MAAAADRPHLGGVAVRGSRLGAERNQSVFGAADDEHGRVGDRGPAVEEELVLHARGILHQALHRLLVVAWVSEEETCGQVHRSTCHEAHHLDRVTNGHSNDAREGRSTGYRGQQDRPPHLVSDVFGYDSLHDEASHGVTDQHDRPRRKMGHGSTYVLHVVGEACAA